jgi:hypothetical protein
MNADKTTRCEHGYDDEAEAFVLNGCKAEATEAVEVFADGVYHFCARHAQEARRLSPVLVGIASGDLEARRLLAWIAEAPDRAEYDRRVATLPAPKGGAA